MSEEPALLRMGMGMKRATWFNFRIDFAASVLFSVYNVVVNQFYVPMAIRHGASNFDVGLLTAAPAIGSLLSPIWAGWMGSRSPMPFVFWPNLFARLSILVVAFWLSPIVFVIVSLFVNFLGAMQAPAYPTLLTRMYPDAVRGRLMGYVRVAQAVFLVPLALLVGDWLHNSSDTWPLAWASVFGVVSLLIFLFVRQVEPAHPPLSPIGGTGIRAHTRAQWHLVRTTPGLTAFLLATSATGFGNLLAAPLFQIYQIHTLNLTSVQIGVTRMAYFLFLLIAYFVLGWVIDKMSARRALVIGMAAYAVAPLLYVIMGNYAAAIGGSGLIGIGDAAWDIGLMSYVFRMAPGREAAVFGIHLLLFGLRGTVAPLLSTAAAGVVPLQAILVTATLFCVLGMVVFQKGSGKVAL